MIFIGHGVTLSEASRELTEFAQKLDIPVISSPNGMGCFDMTDPLSLGFIGRNGAFPANEAGRRADLVVAIGARFDDRSASSWMPGYSWNFPHDQAYPCRCRSSRNRPQLSARSRNSCRRAHIPASVAWPSSKGAATGAATPSAWLADIAKWRVEWDKFTRPNFDMHASPIRPERIVADCQAVLPDDAILACDVGVNHNWYMQFWKARKPQTMLNSWGFSGMGFGDGRRAWRQARRARPASGGDRRRRLLHHGAARALHRGRIQHPGRVGDLEQFRLGLDPRHPARHVRRPRTRHRCSTRATTRSRTIRISPPGPRLPASTR